MTRSLFQKPTTCKCVGGFRINGTKWVSLESSGTSHLIKCLRCGWKWNSRAKYAERLNRHKEVSRSGMADEHILERIRNGSLRVDIKLATVESLGKGGEFKSLRIINRHSNGSSYRFVEIGFQGMQKKIALHRLVWMAHHMQTVPDGFDVDHIRGKVGGDGIENLRLLDSSRNRSLGKPIVSENGEFPF